MVIFFLAFLLSLLLVIPCRMVKLYGDDVRNFKLLGSSRSYGPLDLSGDFTMLNAEIRNKLHPHTHTHTGVSAALCMFYCTGADDNDGGNDDNNGENEYDNEDGDNVDEDNGNDEDNGDGGGGGWC